MPSLSAAAAAAAAAGGTFPPPPIITLRPPSPTSSSPLTLLHHPTSNRWKRLSCSLSRKNGNGVLLLGCAALLLSTANLFAVTVVISDDGGGGGNGDGDGNASRSAWALAGDAASIPSLSSWASMVASAAEAVAGGETDTEGNGRGGLSWMFFGTGGDGNDSVGTATTHGKASVGARAALRSRGGAKIYLSDPRESGGEKSDATASVSASASSFVTESYVISMHPRGLDAFRAANRNDSDYDDVLWVPAVDGHNQRTLDLWRDMSGLALKAESFQRGDKQLMGPHPVGVYLAHWHLVRTLAHRKKELRPDAYFVFEDDATCVMRLKERTRRVIESLPPGWDMLYVGGKPFTTFHEGRSYTDSTKESFRRDVCRGAFGKGNSPLAPDGSRKLSSKQPYWQTKYTTNTEAYVINPKRIDRLLKVLDPYRGHDAIDQRVANAMLDGTLNVYMPTMTYCRQGRALVDPVPWEGYFSAQIPNVTKDFGNIHPAWEGMSWPYVWGQMIINDDQCEY